MAKQKPQAAPSGKMTASDAEAQAVLKMQSWIEEVDSAERMQVGTWYDIPDAYKQWRFIRCGLRNSDRAMALRASLMRMGYQDAPKGVRCCGFESDGDHGLYVCVPEQVWMVIKDRKERARRSMHDTISSQMSADLGGGILGPGSSIQVTGQTHTGTARDIVEHLRSNS
tara:strand:- start:1042 stop:1548 length:507 start_codon:yes stop_codon:yes gene_type:complete